MTDLNAPIKEVTVYSDRALVTREGSIQLEAGEHELRVNDLPQFQRESLRTAGQGPQGMRILNVDITTAFHSRPPETELLTLQTELEQLQQKRQLLDARQDSLNDRRKWLRSIGEQSKDLAKGLAQGQMKAQDCAELFSFMANQAQQDAEAALNLEVQLRQLREEIAAKQRELNQKMGVLSPDRQAAVITLELATGGEVTLELSYIVENASWYPQYDARVQVNEAGTAGEVELTYTGMVQQSTGEAWEKVELSLSTARPSLASVLPELDPWYLSVYTPPVPRAPMQAMAMKQHSRNAEMPVFAAAMPAPTGALFEESQAAGGMAYDMLMSAPAEIATATVEHTGTAYVFRAGRAVDIPSDGSPHKTTIARDNLPCEFDYVSAPVLEQDTHLRAAITNTTERVLLAGSASIFLSGEYVGTTQVKTTATGEKFKIFLGLDDAIKVKRELTEHATEKGNILQSDLRRITYAYRITVHNYAAYPRTIVVRDHLPVAQHERIKVRVQNVQPQPAERNKLEILKWRFTLPPDGEQKIEYRFTVEHPQDLKVIGLPS